MKKLIKGLDALKDIRDICSDMTTVFDEDLNIIEKELKVLEQVYQIIENNEDINDSETLNKIYNLLKEDLNNGRK